VSGSRVIVQTKVVTRVIREGKVGPAGPAGSAGGASETATDGITPASTVVIASITLSTHLAAKFYVAVIDPTNSLQRWSEIDANHSPTSGASHTEFGTLGDSIDYSLDVVDNGTTLDLELTNNEAVNLNTRVMVHRVSN